MDMTDFSLDRKPALRGVIDHPNPNPRNNQK
jgi:hypothetical protein